MNKKKVLGVIPARFKSSRFPNKVIHPIHGKPMIYWVYHRSLKTKGLDDLIVATDNEIVKKECESFSIPVMMTSEELKSGTERIIEVSQSLDADLYINIQGDEPLIEPRMLEDIIQFYQNENYQGIITLKKQINNREDLFDQNIVKVVSNCKNEAMYFSRTTIPNFRGLSTKYFKHVGIYAYPQNILQKISEFPVCELEESEQLEQLRYLYNGVSIKTLLTDYDSISVDTVRDLVKVEALLKP